MGRHACAEFFVQTKPQRGYFNIEVNCGGTMLLYYVEDPTMTQHGLARAAPVLPEFAAQISILHTLPTRVEPAITADTRWSIAYRVPFVVFEHYVGSIGSLAGQIWRGNLFKCADQSSHPHWGTWSPIGEELNFHQPKYFGELHLQ